jgi:hypothetical protein
MLVNSAKSAGASKPAIRAMITKGSLPVFNFVMNNDLIFRSGCNFQGCGAEDNIGNHAA